MEFEEIAPSEAVLNRLIALSKDWEAEQSCYGYRQNTPEDLCGRRIFAAKSGDTIVGYLFGKTATAQNRSSIMPDGTPYFEIEELYIVPQLRSRGIGRQLFACAESALRAQGIPYLMLSTATKNYRAILHFYIDEVGMEFWSASLYKKLTV